MHGYKTEKPKEKLKKSRKEKDIVQKDFCYATVNIILEVISMFVVPVMVRHKRSNQVVKTYAMLNTCSQATFAKESLLSDLGIQGGRNQLQSKPRMEKLLNHQKHWII